MNASKYKETLAAFHPLVTRILASNKFTTLIHSFSNANFWSLLNDKEINVCWRKKVSKAKKTLRTQIHVLLSRSLLYSNIYCRCIYLFSSNKDVKCRTLLMDANNIHAQEILWGRSCSNNSMF